MNTRKIAIESILSFLQTEERVLLLTGTHQNEKHILALSTVLSQYKTPATVLFRTNSMSNVEDFLSPVIRIVKKPRTGVPMPIVGGYNLYVDTINPASWRATPHEIDVSLVYPLDSLDYERGDYCVQDLLQHRGSKKVFLISWTDNVDFDWVEQFNPVHTVFDAEEERPDYHQRMLDYLASIQAPRQLTEKLPAYANSIPEKYLIKILCRGKCSRGRWAVLNLPYPGKSALRSAAFGTYRGKCLVCGYEATDNYNWYR